MDFWARLIGGVGASPTSKQADSNPQQRLARFKRTYAHLVQHSHNADSIADPSTSETLRALLQRLTAILHEESHSSPPHTCLSFASSAQIHSAFSRIGSRARHDTLVREVINGFSTLIDCDDAFLEDEGFANSLVDFVRVVAGANATVVGEEAEGDIIELMFGVAAKIRLQPEILPVWFTAQDDALQDRARDLEQKDVKDFAGITKREDFPLFYLLIDYVHHEGRVGDFARTGLLYIIESASMSDQLEHWIIESDLATLMASGLGALYSQLSRKLAIVYKPEDLPAVISLSDYTPTTVSGDTEISSSPEFQSHLETFLSYLAFWQDVLDHCKSIDVKQTLLDHFRVLFLQQLLYPSLLESSDIDGGSSIAVLTYLRRILESLERPDIIHLILEYLLALPEEATVKTLSSPRSPKSPLTSRRRQTLDLMSENPPGESRPTPTLFNLVDLTITSLKSHSQQTKAATLRLISVILSRHTFYAFSTLLQTVPNPGKKTARTSGGLDREVGTLFSFIDNISPVGATNETYEDHLADVSMLLENHPCSEPLLKLQGRLGPDPIKRSTSRLSINAAQRTDQSYLLSSEDPLFNTMLEIFEGFFSNPIETNIGLTAAVSDLAACAWISLEGWLAVDPEKYDFEDNADSKSNSDSGYEELPQGPGDQERHQRSRGLEAAQRQPSWKNEDAPPLMAVLSRLVEQLNELKSGVDEFDDLVLERKQAFQVSDELKEALASNTLPIRPKAAAIGTAGGGTPSSGTPAARGTPVIETVPQRRLAETKSRQRSSSPKGVARGRGPTAPGTPSRSGLSQQQVQSPHTPGSPSPPVRARTFPTPSSSQPFHQPPPPDSPVLSASGGSDAEGVADEVAHGLGLLPPPSFATRDSRILTRKIRCSELHNGVRPVQKSDEDKPDAESASGDESEDVPNITVTHLLTNTVILQEFILELAALMQVRASMFGEREVAFTL